MSNTLNFEVEKNLLVDGLSIVGKALSGKSSLDILKGVKVRLDGTMLELFTTDTDISVRHKINLATMLACEGEFVVLDGKLFVESVKKMPNGIITLVADDKALTIKQGKAKVTMAVTKADDFPKEPTLGESKAVKILTKTFKDMVSKIAYAAALDDIRPILKGVKFGLKGKKLSLAALDGMRLASTEASVDSDDTISAVVPVKSISDAASAMTEENVSIKIAVNHVAFSNSHTTVIARLLDGDYPEYQKLIPQDFERVAIVNKNLLIDSIDRAAIVAKEGTSTIKMTFKEDEILLVGKSSAGDSEDSITPTSFEGTELTICFNVKFLLDALKKIDTDEVYIKLISHVSPVLVIPVGEVNYELLHMVLPVRG